MVVRRPSELADREDVFEGLRGEVDDARCEHALLALGLLLEQLLLPRLVSAIQLVGDRLAEGLDGLAGNDLSVKRGLDLDFKQRARERVFEPRDVVDPNATRLVPVGNKREGIDGLSVEEDGDQAERSWPVPVCRVLERRIPSRARLELVHK